jgi:hypothetical protein
MLDPSAGFSVTTSLDVSITAPAICLYGLLFLVGVAVVVFGFVSGAYVTRKMALSICICGCLTAAIRLAWVCGQLVGYGPGLPVSETSMYILSRFAYVFLTMALCLLLIHWVVAVHGAFFPTRANLVILVAKVAILAAFGVASVYWIVMGVLHKTGVTDASQLLASTFEVVLATILLVYSGVTLHFVRQHEGSERRNAILMVVTMCLIVASFCVRTAMSSINWWSSDASNITVERDRMSFALVYFVPESLTLCLIFVLGFFTFRAASVGAPKESISLSGNAIRERNAGAVRYENF